MRARPSPGRPDERSRNATYVYCLISAARAPLVRGVPGSVPGAGPPRLLPIDRGVWAVVADAPLERFAGEALQQEMQDVEGISRHAFAHAAVIEFFFKRSAVIPLKLFTLFSTDEKVQAHVRSRLPSLKKMFASLRGLEEWAVRIFAREVEAESARSLESGRDYLRLKKRIQQHNAAPPKATSRTIDGALAKLGRVAVKTRKESFPVARGRPFVSGASYLVKATRRRTWKTHAAGIASALEAQGHRLEMTGPWPPYHFVSNSMRRKKAQESGDWLFPQVSAGKREQESSLLDVLDNVLNRGAVLNGDIVLGVANVDLIYVKLSVLLAAVDKVIRREPVFRPVATPRAAKTARRGRKR